MFESIVIGLATFVFSVVTTFTTTQRIFSNLASKNLKNNQIFTEKIVEEDTPQILGEADEKAKVTFNIDAIFSKSLTIKDKITANNIVYSVNPGLGISIGLGQTPVISNTGVISLNNKTGNLKLENGTGITIDGLKISNSGIISLSAGSGISVSGSTITNSGIVSLSLRELASPSPDRQLPIAIWAVVNISLKQFP